MMFKLMRSSSERYRCNGEPEYWLHGIPHIERKQDPYPGAVKEKENQNTGELSENGENLRTGEPESNDTLLLGRMKL